MSSRRVIVILMRVCSTTAHARALIVPVNTCIAILDYYFISSLILFK